MPMAPWCVACLAPSAHADRCERCAGELVALEVHPAAAENAKRVAEQLRTWRNRQARIQRTDVFMVVPNKTLACLVAVQPESREALRTTPGIGPAKDRDYGYVLTRYFRDLHAGRAAEPILARGPMPEGLTEGEEALVVAVRETRTPLHELAAEHSAGIDDLLSRLARLVEKGAPDLAQLLCAPAEVQWLGAHLEAHPQATPGELAQAFPHVSRAAIYLVPALLRERKA